ncbi:hypothetical protein Bca52824_004705 [Brassica carinata]|uniref:Uncharacterized protein n=1 Tax=Brassica carinata TaxID=52824 RepID=A0A8X7WR07_BRACI|nr:hypothetical protein Bca52824_004705 [Brassica carinata]
MDLKDSSEDNVQSAKDNLHDSSADSSGKTLLRADPRWPHLKKWLVTISSSPQVSQSVPPLKSKTLELEEDVPQTSSCVPESGEEITSSKDMISLTQNLSPVTVQDPKYACEGQQKLPSDSSLAPATSSPSPSLGAWTIPLKIVILATEENNMVKDKEERVPSPNHSVMSVTVPHTPTPSVAATPDSNLALATNKPNDQITSFDVYTPWQNSTCYTTRRLFSSQTPDVVTAWSLRLTATAVDYGGSTLGCSSSKLSTCHRWSVLRATGESAEGKTALLRYGCSRLVSL